jgi:hypothetical protein
MAADNSPPRIQPIMITAFIAVLVLVGLKFVFDSYYIEMFEAEEYRKVGSVEPLELLALRAAEKKGFAAAPVPLDRAMALVAKGRAEPVPGGKGGDITPQPSTDYAALAGWAQLPTPAFVVPEAAPAPDSSAAPTGSAAPATSGSAAVAVPPAPTAANAAPVSPRASAAPPPAPPSPPKAPASAAPPAPPASAKP